MLVHTSQKQANHDAIARAIARWTKAAINCGDFLARCEAVYKYETTNHCNRKNGYTCAQQKHCAHCIFFKFFHYLIVFQILFLLLYSLPN